MSTDGTAASFPLLETVAVEDVLAGDGEETGGVIHALEADGTGRELDEVGCWWWEGLEEVRVRGGWREWVMRELWEAGIRSGGAGRLEGY